MGVVIIHMCSIWWFNLTSEVVKEVDQTNHYCRTSLFQREYGENFIKQFALKKGR